MFMFANDAKGIEMMAIFVATLFKQGITFTSRSDSFSFEITLKGF